MFNFADFWITFFFQRCCSGVSVRIEIFNMLLLGSEWKAAKWEKHQKPLVMYKCSDFAEIWLTLK